MPVNVWKPKGERYYRYRYRIEPSERYTFGSTRRSEERLAQRVADRIFLEAVQERDGVIPPKAQRDASRTKLADLVEPFIQHLESEGSCRQYVKAERQRLERLLRETGWMLLRDINRDSFESWRNRQASKAEPMHEKTQNDYLVSICHLVKWMMETERISANPLASVKKLKVLDRSRVRRTITPEQLGRLAEVSGKRGVTYLAAAYTGLRHKELRSLEWRDVSLDCESPVLQARARISKGKKQVLLPLHPDVVQGLLSIRPDEQEPFGKVFRGLVPRPPRFRKDLKAAGIEYCDANGEYFDFHSLRGMLATRLNEVGATELERAELMRHCDARLTRDRYTDNRQLRLHGIVRLLPSVLKSSAQPAAQLAAQSMDHEQLEASNGVQMDKSGVASQHVEVYAIDPICPPVSKTVQRDEMVRAAGFEPASIPCKIKGSKGIAAQLAAQLAQDGGDLAELLAAWPHLPLPLRAAVMAIVRSQRGESSGNGDG